jgi:GcrA cell cycle regulator
MDWTEDTIAKLRALWAEGLSTAEIGRRLNVSKNAVVGKAHRLELPARPSPIRRIEGDRPAARPPAPKRAQGPTLPPLSASLGGSVSMAAGHSSLSRAGERATDHAPATRQTVRPAMASVAKPYVRTVPCCWPIGEPGTESFHFCSAQAITGKPYCEEHAAIAYVRVRDRREDAA